ncbi:unnamed protein product [Porites evermanni]|uniref:nucleoside-diphosphate kinase n=1 Tax=Porites evermanni TaxID=104178 RepID=A0ABN8LH16_9CNID|nr:unnamed protein product [Porites evermanni]
MFIQNTTTKPEGKTDDGNTIRTVLLFKDQIAANAVCRRLRDLSNKIAGTLQPSFVSKKFEHDLKPKEIKLSIKRRWYQFSIKKYKVKKLNNKKVGGHAAEIKSELPVGKSAEPPGISPHKVENKPDKTERTLIMVKPDGVQRGLIGDIIKRFEQKGFKLVAMKFMQASEEHLRQHYADLSNLPYFPGLVKHMASGPVVAMVWEGLGVVKTGRKLKPRNNPLGLLTIIHGSDSVESAEKEIALWFSKQEEMVDWTPAAFKYIYEK